MSGADPAGSLTAFCASAGPGAKPGRTAHDGATKGPPSRFVSECWEACGHYRKRQGRACPVPIRRAVPTASCAAAGLGAKPGRTAQDGATKGPPWRFLSECWKACGHIREREGHCCAVPIRRVGPLLSVLLPGRVSSQERQPRTERRKGRPGALSVDAGRPADTTDSGRAGLVRCRSGGQSHCFLCCCRAGRPAGKDSPGRSDERAALALCQ